MSRYHVILNARSGTAMTLGLTAETLEARFAAAGHTATVDADSDRPFGERIERARRSDADVIVAAGGDGTVTAVAEALVDTDKALAVLPLGTVNLLARDLAVPLEVDAWMAALGEMRPRRIDAGEVNGRIFLHKVVAGAVPGIAAGREQIRGRGGISARFGFLMFLFRRLLRARRMAVEIVDDSGTPRLVRAAAIAVANNSYDEGLGRFFARQRIDRGTLSLYLLRHFTLGDALRLAAEMVAGNWRNDDALEIVTATSLSLRTRKGKLKVMLDGEVLSLDVPLSFRIRPLALWVLAPVLPAVAATEETPAAMEPAVAGAVAVGGTA